VREAAGGAVIVIERRGEPVAELRPLTTIRPKPKVPNMTRFWTKFPQVPGDSQAYLEEDR
jgi:antitoxin (DNA-binding transcriptional repressor) of toxin-antitoxin stability system